MSKKRSDIHSEANFVPEDYVFYNCYDAHPDYPMGDFWLEMKREVISAVLSRNGSIHPLGSCALCGHVHLRYVNVFTHVPTDKLICVGQSCAYGRMEMDSSEFDRFMRIVKVNRAAAKAEGAGAAWRANNTDLVVFFTEELPTWKFYSLNFLNSLAGQVKSKGKLSGFQTDAARRCMINGRPHEAKAATRDADRATEKANAVDCPEGRMVITGEIVKLDSKAGYAYNTVRWVMTVKDDRGFVLWGTQPASLSHAEKGDRVQFTATIERSDQDAKFGFFKRPSKAMVRNDLTDLPLTETQTRQQALSA